MLKDQLLEYLARNSGMPLIFQNFQAGLRHFSSLQIFLSNQCYAHNCNQPIIIFNKLESPLCCLILTVVLFFIVVVVALIVAVVAVLRLEVLQSHHSPNLHFGLQPIATAYDSWIIQLELLTHVDICSTDNIPIAMIAKKNQPFMFK